jgi:hypothetical protein
MAGANEKRVVLNHIVWTGAEQASTMVKSSGGFPYLIGRPAYSPSITPVLLSSKLLLRTQDETFLHEASFNTRNSD